MGWFLVGRLAHAGVRMQDPSGCVDREAVDLEVRDLVGDAAVDGLDLFVRVTPDDRARDLEIRVSDNQGTLLWNKSLLVQSTDCPLLPGLISRSVESGLSSVPGWRLLAERGRSAPEAGLYFAISAPATLRAGFGGGGRIPVVGRLWGAVELDGYVSAFGSVGTGTVQVAALGGAAGPVLRTRVGADAIDLGLRAWVGGVGVFGRAYDRNDSSLLPRVSINGEALFASHAALRAGVRTEVPLTRLVFVAGGTSAPTVEPPVRVGIVLGFGGPVGSGDGGGSDRP